MAKKVNAEVTEQDKAEPKKISVEEITIKTGTRPSGRVDDMSASARLTDPAVAWRFLLAGNAIFSMVSGRTGVRYTFRLSRGKPRDGDDRPPPWFLSSLVGPSNTDDYAFIATAFAEGVPGGGGERVQTVRAAKGVDPRDKRVLAVAWLIDRLRRGELPATVEFWSSGACGRCGRLLTTPESVERGIGPECWERMGC